MKKLLAIAVVFALLLPVIAGCQSAYAAANTPVTPEQALDIALQDADMNTQDVRHLEIEPDRDRGETHYDVDFEKDGKEYDYEIHAETGEILNKETPTPVVTPEPVPETTPGPMTRQEAIAIALAHAGLTSDQVRDLDAELDKERGVVYYEVDFESGAYEYEYEIHAETGAILKSEKERD